MELQTKEYLKERREKWFVIEITACWIKDRFKFSWWFVLEITACWIKDRFKSSWYWLNLNWFHFGQPFWATILGNHFWQPFWATILGNHFGQPFWNGNIDKYYFILVRINICKPEFVHFKANVSTCYEAIKLTVNCAFWCNSNHKLGLSI